MDVDMNDLDYQIPFRPEDPERFPGSYAGNGENLVVFLCDIPNIG